jgi:hypothetical protein
MRRQASKILKARHHSLTNLQNCLAANWARPNFVSKQRQHEIERATEQRLREIERARAEQLDIARSWILLFTLAATFGLWWVFYNQLKLDFYV